MDDQAAKGPVVVERHLTDTSMETARRPLEQRRKEDALRHAIVALVALMLLIMLVVLQLAGLAYAIKGLKRDTDMTVSWCSPAFQDSTLAVRTGNCDIYTVTTSASNGIGCVDLPATEQRGWLVGTIVILSAALVLQACDMILLRCAKGRKFRGVKMQRPWLTMFTGITILIVIICYGVFAAMHLPSGVTETVWVYRKENNPAAIGRVCQGVLSPSGLRGMIIGWTDGLFDSWGAVYRGIV